MTKKFWGKDFEICRDAIKTGDSEFIILDEEDQKIGMSFLDMTDDQLKDVIKYHCPEYKYLE